MISSNVVPIITPQWDQDGEIRFIPNRVCVPVGMACNVSCSYCLRLAGKTREPKGLSKLMRRFLSGLDPKKTEAVVINGGEPLLYMDRIKEIFSLVPKEIHRVVMTNGILLTQEIVDYLKSENTEIHFSHEGTGAKALKGIDVLEDERIVDLLNQFDKMRCYTILTACNSNALANYEYIRSKIRVRNFYYTQSPMFAFAGNERLVEGYDFDGWIRSVLELHDRYPEVGRMHPDHIARKQTGVNVLMDGSVASISTLKVYGSVLNTRKEIQKRISELGDDRFCLEYDCDYRSRCKGSPQCASPFTCKAVNLLMSAYEAMEHYHALFRH